jgi:ZIP family zinc transporter
MDMIGWVFLAALVTALATGLGALPLAFASHTKRSWIGVGNGLAAGMMSAATAALVYEGWSAGATRTLAGAVAGAIFMGLVWKLFSRHEHAHLGTLRGVDAIRALTIVAVMTLHSFTEGVGVGVAFGDGKTLGLLIAVAIAVHNIPEGLAVSLVLVPRGVRLIRAAGWSVFTSLPQPLMAVPAFLFVDSFRPLLPVGLGFAGGAMIWIVLTQLVPDALAVSRPRTVLVAACVAAGAMLGLQAVLLGI